MDVVIYRGTKEIGGICIEVANEGTRILIDIGMPLVSQDGERFNLDESRHLSPAELKKKGVLPPVEGLYYDGTNQTIDALLITHSHPDHYGLYSYVDQNIQCYLGEGTRRLIELNNLFFRPKTHISGYHTFESGIHFEVGQFKITPFLMDHSAFDSYAFLIESGGKKIIYSGDFRGHGRKVGALKRFLEKAPKNVDALLLEGTTLGRSPITSITEERLEEEIRRIFQGEPNIALAVLSGQNIDRLVSFYKAAVKAKRFFVIDVYTAAVLDRLKDLARIPFPSRGFPNLRVIYNKRLCDRLAKAGLKDLLFKFRQCKIEWDEILASPEKIVLVMKGSMLSDLEKRPGLAGGTVIYSMWEGYLREGTLKEMMKYLKVRNFNLKHIHSSGHACQETLKVVVEKLKPRQVIPIHTFYPERYAELIPGPINVSEDKVSIKI